jgi:hypothetical protein
MRDVPDTDGGVADSDSHNRTELGEDRGDRVGDGEVDTDWTMPAWTKTPAETRQRLRG